MSADDDDKIKDVKDLVEQMQKFLFGRCSKCQAEIKILAVTFRLVPSFAIELILAPHICKKQKLN